MPIWPLPQRVSTLIGAILLVLYLARADGLFFGGFVLFALVGLGPTALKSVRLSRQELALTFRQQSEKVAAAIDNKAEEVAHSSEEPSTSRGTDLPPPRVTGKDAEVLRRVADALEAEPPTTPAEFANAFAQAVAAVLSHPTLSRGQPEQMGGDITITEPQAGVFKDGDQVVISLDVPGVTFSRPPWATVNRSDLKLRAGAAAATSGLAALADDRRSASWTVWSTSTSLSVIVIVGLFFDVSDEAPTGPLRVGVRVGHSLRSLVTGTIVAAE